MKHRVWPLLFVVCVGIYGYIPGFMPAAEATTVHVLERSFGGEGTGIGQFKDPVGVAVNDASPLVEPVAGGDVYVVDEGGDRVERFSAAGEYEGQFNGLEYESEGKKTLDSPVAPAGAFVEPTLVAVDSSGSMADPSNGDVYVVDSGHGVIDKFTAAGAYLGQVLGRCEKGEEAPPCTGSKLVAFRKGEFGVSGIAVDSRGTLWADEYASGRVYRFSDALENGYMGRCETIFGKGINNLGVDSEEDLYLSPGRTVKVTNLCQTLVGSVGPGESTFGIAVDWRGGEAYLDFGKSIGAFTLGGSKEKVEEVREEERFGEADLPADQYGRASQGVAVNTSTGSVYATDFANNNVTVFRQFTLPTVELVAPSEQTPASVTLNGLVNPEGFLVTSCRFEYAPEASYDAKGKYEKSVACEPASVGSGSTPVAVSAKLSGLAPATGYVYRLVAENEAGIPSAASSSFYTGPLLGGEYVTGVTSESVTLNVPIDPNGDDTHYYFQLGTSTAYGVAVPAPPPGADIGSAPGERNISVHVQVGLAPGATYHYRVVVSQGGMEFPEPDRTFTMQQVLPGPVLPDNRGWELVSPGDKKGALIEPFSNFTSGGGDDIQAAADGHAITYMISGPSVGEGAVGSTTHAQTLSARVQGDVWRSADLVLPRRLPGGGEPASSEEGREEYDLFSSDLSTAVVEPPLVGTPRLSAEAPERTIYLRYNGQGSYVPLVWPGNVSSEKELEWGTNSAEQAYFVTATPDLSHVLLASPHAFTPEAVYGGKEYLAHGQWNLYEWAGGGLQLVNVLPASEGGEPTHGVAPSVRLAGGTVDEGNPDDVNPSAVSADGRRVAWALGNPAETLGREYKGFFVRDMVAGETVKVAGEGGVFQWMSSDGSRVFFLEDGDLHVCELAEGATGLSCVYSDLTADRTVGETDGGVQELVSGVSRDGSSVYIVAHAVLGGSAGTEGAVSGGDNLYLLRSVGGVWSTRYVATLGAEDAKSWSQVEPNHPPDLSHISSRVSSDGRFLVFMSDRSLTGYDNVDAVSGKRDEEVFVYDAQTERLACVSCDPTGGRALGVLDPLAAARKPLVADREGVWAGSSLAGIVPGWQKDFVEGSRYQPRYLADSGRVFFDSPDGLVPRASNGVMNVYEWEPVGVGGCREGLATGGVVFAGSSGGCVGLVSSGISGQESVLFDASETGNDVFFTTQAKLVGADYDNAYDVYDAHVCGNEGVACVSEPSVPGPCVSVDACRVAPTAQPELFGAPPSATFSGQGNVVEETKKNGHPPKKAGKKKKRRTRRRKGRARTGRRRVVAGVGARSRRDRRSGRVGGGVR